MNTPIRVLIVEDSQDDAALLLLELESGGYDPTFERIDTATAMKTALAKQPWDIIIADYSMPHFSALAALQLLRRTVGSTCLSSSCQAPSARTLRWQP